MGTSKLKSSLLYILEEAGDMEIMRLAKFLYLADYAYAKLFGDKHGFIDEHQRYQYGPVPAAFYDEYNALLAEKVIDRKANIVVLKRRMNVKSQLSDKELACLDKVIHDFSGKNLNDVKHAAYATEPMKEIQEEEERLGVPRGLVFTKMNFNSVKPHPLTVAPDIDLSFMDTDEFKKNLE